MFSTYVRHMDPNGNCLFEALAWAKKRMELEKEHESGMMKEIDKQAFKSKMKDHINDIRKDCASYFEESMRDFHDLEKGQAENFLQNWQQELRKELSKINSDETQPTANRQLALTHLEYIRNKFQQNRDKLMNLPLLNKMYKTVMTPSEFNRGCLEIPPPWLWGDHIEVWAFANKFKCTIKVIHISKFGTIREDIVEGSDDNKECNLQNRRSIVLVYSESKEHYDMMEVENLHAGMKLDDQSDIFIPKSDDDYSEEETEVHKSDDLTPGEEDRREQQAKKDAKAAKEAARKAAAAKKAEERKAKAADKPVQPNYKQVLDFFEKSCRDFNKMQCKFNLEVLMLLPNHTNSPNEGYDLWKEILAKTEKSESLKKQIYDNIAQYGQDIDQGKVISPVLVKSEIPEATLFSDNLLQWMQSSRLDRERFAWHLFDPKYQENSTDNENKNVNKMVEELRKNKSKKKEEIWRKYLRILHSAVAKFHSNMAFAINYYVQNAVSISANLEETERNQRTDMRRQIFEEFGLHLYPACLPEKIQSNFKNWAVQAINLALSGKKYKIPKGLYNDHEAIAVFKSLVDITAKHLRRSRGDAGWVSRTFNGDGKPNIRFKKDPIRWGAQVTTNNHFLVDPSVPAPVLSTALKGSRRWLISENVNW